jgi:hypothetical protein
MSRIEGFPGAPDDAYLSEEGWLIIGDEAWTRSDWLTRNRLGRPIPDDPDDRVLRRRRTWRESKRRSRQRAA